MFQEIIFLRQRHKQLNNLIFTPCASGEQAKLKGVSSFLAVSIPPTSVKATPLIILTPRILISLQMRCTNPSKSFRRGPSFRRITLLSMLSTANSTFF
jgi:hypothetical protein